MVDHYIEHRARKLPSGAPAERAVQLVIEYLFEVRGLPRTAKADCFGLDLQKGFIRWSAEAYGHSAKYISRNLSVIAAAMHFAAKEQAIEDELQEERTVQLMNRAPDIRYDPEWIAQTAKIPAPRRRDWVPSIEEMARFIDCIRSERFFRFVIMTLNTWARAETVMELDLNKQVNADAGTVDLNPPGRVQNIKRRPVIRLTQNLRAWRAEWKVGRPIGVADVKKAMQRTSARCMMLEAGMDPRRVEELLGKGKHKELTAVVQELVAAGSHRITRRTLRSFMATRVRNQREVRVDREQRQIWLGHLGQDTTSNYEITDPDYLREARDATDLIITRIDAHCRRSLWPEKFQPELPLGGARRR